MKERDNVLRILIETRQAIENDDPSTIKDLSNQTINTASLTQDPDNIAVAVVVYSIGKIMERDNYKELPGWDKFYNIIMNSLNHSIEDIRKNDDKDFRKDFEKIREVIGKISGKLRGYIEDVFRKAQINKASRIYEHGVSMEQTAKLLGISMYELAEYAGTTGISDVRGTQTMKEESRIKIALNLFD